MMHVAEIFNSIQGEGPAMGRPATFVRLAGCNLLCEGCDTYSYFKDWIELTPKEILGRINLKRAVITGGEPTLQMAELSELFCMISKEGKEAHIETNGTNPIPDEDLRKLHYAVISPKYGSKVDLAYWSSKENVHLKFVIGPKAWCWPQDSLEKLAPALPCERVWLMPFGSDAGLKYAKDAWDLALKLGMNYSDRLHIRLGRR
ncbi:MAG: 7-carboxy-7-deazaguanine synthase QueE [Methanotrichaceae archaeon]